MCVKKEGMPGARETIGVPEVKTQEYSINEV